MDWTTNTNNGVDRGFTGHEHLDDVGLIHMNGRLYDPTVGRMLQADPMVSDLGNLQNFDRYAYCFNSPLVCTDPTGLAQELDRVDITGSRTGPRPSDYDMSSLKDVDSTSSSAVASQLPRVDIKGKRTQGPKVAQAVGLGLLAFPETGFAGAIALPRPFRLGAQLFLLSRVNPMLVVGAVLMFTPGNINSNASSFCAPGALCRDPKTGLLIDSGTGKLIPGTAINAVGADRPPANPNAPPPDNAYDPNGPKAPGRPGKAEGFESPKGGDQWVKNPNGRGYGWLGSDGRVWVPTGPADQSNGISHGGPHWDVQTGGRRPGYENIFPVGP